MITASLTKELIEFIWKTVEFFYEVEFQKKRRTQTNLIESNGIWTHNHLVRQRTFNHLTIFVYELSGCWLNLVAFS